MCTVCGSVTICSQQAKKSNFLYYIGLNALTIVAVYGVEVDWANVFPCFLNNSNKYAYWLL
jgi:hypothetical protein